MNRPPTDAATVDLILTAAKEASLLSDPVKPHMFKVRDVKRVIAMMKGISFNELWKANDSKVCGISGSRISWILKLHPEMFKQITNEDSTNSEKHKVLGFVYIGQTLAEERIWPIPYTISISKPSYVGGEA